MSQRLTQSQTHDRLRKLGQEVDDLKDRLKLAESAPAVTSGYQMLGGRAVFGGGLQVGGTVVYEPYTIPAATGLVLTWSASFDTVGINASWTAPAGLGSDQIASYVVQAQKQGGSVPIETSVAFGSTSTRIEPVEPNTTYLVTVSAMSKLGRLAAALSGTITTGGDTTPPAAPTFPTNPVIPAITGLSIKWTANTERDVANGAGQYRVVVSTNSNLSSPAFDAKTNGTTLFVNPLTAGTPYYVGVYAIDSSGNQSGVGTPAGGPWTPLANVTDTSALAFGGGNIVLNSGFQSPTQALDSWITSPNGATIATDLTTGHGSFGGTSAKISGTGDAYLYQDMTLGVGTWILSVWVKGASVAGAGTGVVLNNELLAGAGTCTVILGAVAGGGNIASAGKGTFDWTRLAVKYTITTQATLRLYLQRGQGGSCSGSAWFDEVQVENGNIISSYAPRPDEILPQSVTSTVIADNSIITSKIAAGSIVAGKIAAGAIGATEIQARSILASNIATDTLTSNEIAASAITANELAANSVTAAAIQANSITAAKIAANTITASNLSVSLGLSVGQFIQSSNFVSGSTGWRIDGAGNAELMNATVRNGAFIGGQVNVANRLFADPGDPTVHLAANVQIGANYNSSIWAGGGNDQRWGLSTGDAQGGGAWTHLNAGLQTYDSSVIGFYDQDTGTRVLLADKGHNIWKPGPAGSLIAEKVGQNGDWGSMGLQTRNGSPNMNEGDLTSAGLSFYSRSYGVASIIYLYGPQGSLLEFKTADNNGFIPVRASSFLTASSSEFKSKIRQLKAREHDVLSNLKPVRFRRPSTHCATCHGTGVVQVERDEHGHADPENAPKKLNKGDRCDHCKGKPGSPHRTKQQRAYEDTDFIGLIAEEVGQHIPEAVAWREKPDGSLSPDSIDYSAIVALLVQKVNVLERRLDAGT